MPIEMQDAQRIVSITLTGAITDEDLGSMMQGIRSMLQQASSPITFVIDPTESSGGTSKQRISIGEFFAKANLTRFGLCAGIAVVAANECQHAFVRGVISMGPIPCAYRIFDKGHEATSWARQRIRATMPPPPG